MNAIKVLVMIFTLIFYGPIFIHVTQSIVCGQWEILNEGFSASSYNIDFVNEKEGWLLLSKTLLKTEDGGETWMTIPQNDDWIFEDIDFINSSVGWAIVEDIVTDEYYIIKSENGGVTWSVVDNTIGTFRSEIYAINDSCVYIADTDEFKSGIIFKTMNNGVSWNDVSPDFQIFKILSISFINADSGIVSAYYRSGDGFKKTVLKTENSGNTWKEVISGLDLSIYNIQFVDKSTAYFWADRYIEIDDQGHNDRLFCKTDDLFESWSILYENRSWISSLYALNHDSIQVLIYEDDNTQLVCSIDGGLTWETKITFEKQIYNKIYYVNKNTGFLISMRPGGRFDPPAGIELLRTMDGGESWKIQLLSYPVNDVNFVNKDEGMICGGWTAIHGRSGAMFATADGGRTWQRNFSDYWEVKSFFYVNDNIAFAFSQGLDEGEKLYKTLDGGQNWSEFHGEITDSIGTQVTHDMFFIDEDHGFLVGYKYLYIGDSLRYRASITATTNGGINWKTAWTGYPTTSEWDIISLNSVCFVEESLGWAVGSAGLILKFSEKNNWQELSAVTDLPLGKVYFSDKNHGWIAGGYFNFPFSHDYRFVFLKTIDGGGSWEEVPSFYYKINEMFFEDSLHGWAVGHDTSYYGIILETTDGGENWIAQVEDLLAPLNTLHFQDGYGWAVGENGLILRTNDGVDWINEKTGKLYPGKFTLSQNYPNPFNPSTKIQFSLPKPDKVKIQVYNTLGQTIEILLNEPKPAGNHEITFNAEQFPSGIYFYRMQVGDPMGKTDVFEDVKKMVLLK